MTGDNMEGSRDVRRWHIVGKGRKVLCFQECEFPKVEGTWDIIMTAVS